jgi:hypothetical protein
MHEIELASANIWQGIVGDGLIYLGIANPAIHE